MKTNTNSEQFSFTKKQMKICCFFNATQDNQFGLTINLTTFNYFQTGLLLYVLNNAAKIEYTDYLRLID